MKKRRGGGSLQGENARLDQILQLVRRLAAGDGAVRGFPGGFDEEYDEIIAGLNRLVEDLAARRRQEQDLQQRMEDLQGVIMSMARLEFSVEIPLGEVDDELTAVTAGLNMLGEELMASTVSRSFLDNIVESMIDPLAVIGLDGTIRMVNFATSELLGFGPDKLVGRKVDVLFKERANFFASLLQTVVDSGLLRDLQTSFRALDGTVIPVSLNGAALLDSQGELDGVVCVGRDMRETRRLLAAEAVAVAQRERAKELDVAYRQLQAAQAQLVQVSKLAALGELSAGIAHELNQPITSIRGFAELISLEAGPLPAQQAEMIGRIKRATERMSRIINNLRVFSRQSSYLMQPTPAIRPLDDALELVSEQLRLHQIQLERDIDEDLPQVMAEAIQLQQVFLNILSNAGYALELLKTGCARRLRLSVGRAGEHVVYVFQDNGPGVAGEHEDRLFDPFFTTKPEGEGMGLGLSLSYGIIENHGGQISYEPVSGGGAKFTVRIPVASSDHATSRGDGKEAG